MTAPRVPMLTGWADQLAPGLQQIGQNLPRLLDSDFDLKNALRKKQLEDPNFAQQFASLSDDERKVFLSNLGAKRESTLSHFNNVAPSIERQGKEIALDTNKQLKAGFDTAMQDPTSRNEIVGKAFGTKTPEERAQAKATTDLTTAQTSNVQANTGLTQVRTQVEEAQLKEIQRKQQQIITALQAHPTLRGVDINGTLNKVLSGETIDPNLMTAILDNPGAKVQVDMLLDLKAREANASLQRTLRSMTNPTERLGTLVQAANLAVTQSKNVLDIAQDEYVKFTSDEFMKTIRPEQKIAFEAEKKALAARITKLKTEYNANQQVFNSVMGDIFKNSNVIDPETLKLLGNINNMLKGENDVSSNSVPPSTSNSPQNQEQAPTLSASDKQKADAVLQRIQQGQGTLEQALASPSIPQHIKDYLKSIKK